MTEFLILHGVRTEKEGGKLCGWYNHFDRQAVCVSKDCGTMFSRE